MLDIPGDKLADSLTKTRATLPFVPVPSLLAPVIDGKDKAYPITHYCTWKRNLSHNSLFCQIPLVSSEDLALPHLACC